MIPGEVEWHGDRVLLHATDAAERALTSAAEFGHSYWDATVPVSTDPRTSGDLRRSWLQEITTGTRLSLTISANTRYAIYVELGAPAKNMQPRAPLRATAGEIVAILPAYVLLELTE